MCETIVEKVPVMDVHTEKTCQMQLTSHAYSRYGGVIGTGRIKRGRIKQNTPVAVVNRDGTVRNGRVLQVLGFMGLDKVEVAEAQAGDIVAVTGIAELGIDRKSVV